MKLTLHLGPAILAASKQPRELPTLAALRWAAFFRSGAPSSFSRRHRDAAISQIYIESIHIRRASRVHSCMVIYSLLSHNQLMSRGAADMQSNATKRIFEDLSRRSANWDGSTGAANERFDIPKFAHVGNSTRTLTGNVSAGDRGGGKSIDARFTAGSVVSV